MSAATIEDLLHDSEDRLDTAKHVHSDQQVVAQAAIAQVLATQALVAATQAQTEQMRIGNLIAICSAENADFFNLMPEKAGRAEMYGSMFGQMLGEIREGLGVE